MASAMSSLTSAIGISGHGFIRTRDFPSSILTSSASSRMAANGGVKNFRSAKSVGNLIVKAVEAETLVHEHAEANHDSDQPESVSPSDILTMLFQAEGTMKEAAIPSVTKALTEIEGVADLKVQLLEGIASVELTKQTTIQSTGVASSLIESIQGSGFKLQTLHLSFLDEADTSEYTLS